jgi:hypothetical protein
MEEFVLILILSPVFFSASIMMMHVDNLRSKMAEERKKAIDGEGGIYFNGRKKKDKKDPCDVLLSKTPENVYV